MHRIARALQAVALLCLCVAAHADDVLAANARIDELIVTGMRAKRLAELPRSANVITAEDIALSPSTNIVDLIAREANVQLRSTVGNDKFSGVDIRGQGDTYTSNVLVLVDGIRLNSEDQAGPDYSSLPLEQVERIEVIRGANSVRYGNGAVGGVINIITRRAGGDATGVNANARLRAGSYGTSDAGLGVSWSSDRWSFIGDVVFYDTDGYRDNSQLQKKDLAARVGFDPVDWFGVSLGGILHRDEFGFPGPVSKTEYEGSDADREAASTPYANGSTDDDRLRFDLTAGNLATGEFLLSMQTRDRKNPYRLGPVGPDAPYDIIREDREAVDAKYEKDFEFFGHQHAFALGFDLANTDYSRESGNPTTEPKQGQIRQQAWFTAADLHLRDDLIFSAGYRQDSFVSKGHQKEVGEVCTGFEPFLQCTPIFETRDSWRNNVVEAGLVYTPTDSSNWYVSFSQSFRNPNVDDLVVADDDLRPQSANHWDAGLRQLWGRAVEFSFSAFYSETKHEILYGIDPLNPTKQLNRNADQPTKRKGAETDVRWYTTDTLSFNANAGYMNARFAETNTYVPMVPKWTAALGVEWEFASDWVVIAQGNYVGSRFDGNDFSNKASGKVAAYQLVDMKLSYQQNSMQIYAGIDNLLDEVYSASVYSENFYPMPDRNYYVGITYRMGSN